MDKFIKFLKDNECYIIFINNLKRFDNSIENLIDCYPIERYFILNAFFWEDTPQKDGDDFWRKIDILWTTELKLEDN